MVEIKRKTKILDSMESRGDIQGAKRELSKNIFKKGLTNQEKYEIILIMDWKKAAKRIALGTGAIVLAVTMNQGGTNRPDTIVLHDTVTDGVNGAVNGLKARGLSYHYLIDRDGKVYQLVDPHKVAYHASRRNLNTIGISYIGGGKHGPMTETQIEASIKLIKALKKDFSRLKYVTSHEAIASNGKVDPEWICDKPGRLGTECDRQYLGRIGKATGLYPLTRDEVFN